VTRTRPPRGSGTRSSASCRRDPSGRRTRDRYAVGEDAPLSSAIAARSAVEDDRGVLAAPHEHDALDGVLVVARSRRPAAARSRR
jgi:hypothetical protein